MRFKNPLLLTLYFLSALISYSQSSPIYKNLPVGKYPVGFKIITIADPSRVALPEYNYLGEKNEGDRTKKLTIHLWYPAKASTEKPKMTYGDYCYNHLRTVTDEPLTQDQISGQLTSRRSSIDGWYGKPSDDAWKRLVDSPMLAMADASQAGGKFPLLVGMLRPLSTSITNEMLASNGFVVAMIVQGNFNLNAWTEIALDNVPSMQFVIGHLIQNGNVDESRIGTFGFSGSGFMQLLLAMHDYRIKAVADIESALFGLPHHLASNYYNVQKLRVPFLHIYNRELAKRDTHFNEFFKMKFSKRFHLILNQENWHHWNVATEGYTSCVVLNNRGSEQINIQQSFEIANIYLLNFFNAELKNEQSARTFLSSKKTLPTISSALWDFDTYPALRPAPNSVEFENIIRTKGINMAIDIVNNTIKNDSSTNIYQGFVLNNLGSVFLRERKYNEVIEIFKLNVQLHPYDANLWDSLAEAYEAMGDKEKMKKTSQQVLDLLIKKPTLTEAENSLKELAEQRLKI